MRKMVMYSVGASLLVVGSFFAGYQIADSQASYKKLDQLLLDISSDLLVRDALEAAQGDKIRSLIDSRIESNFAHIVRLHSQRHIKKFDYVRCVVTRRMRQLKADHKLLIDVQELRDSGLPVESVFEYLDSECPGAPSHDSWIEPSE